MNWQVFLFKSNRKYSVFLLLFCKKSVNGGVLNPVIADTYQFCSV